MTNKHKPSNRAGFLLPLFYVVTPIIVAMRSFACIRYMDEFGYFGGSALMIAANVAAALFTLVFFTHALSHHRKDSVPKESFLNRATYITSAVLGTAIAFAIYETVSLRIIVGGSINHISGTDYIYVITALLGAAALVFIVLNALIEAMHSRLRAAFGILTALFFAMYAVCMYLDGSVAANMQQRTITVLAMAMGAVFFLYETRIPLGHPRWHSYVAFGLMASLLLFYSSAPALIYYGVSGALIPGSSAAELGVAATLAIYTATRVTLLAFAPEDEVCDLADSIMDMEHKRNSKN